MNDQNSILAVKVLMYKSAGISTTTSTIEEDRETRSRSSSNDNDDSHDENTYWYSIAGHGHDYDYDYDGSSKLFHGEPTHICFQSYQLILAQTVAVVIPNFNKTIIPRDRHNYIHKKS